ncbi:glutathione S-transferase family protein [Bradyrhizobium genosp. A]|uniref:glutathione S-transferase family protein n=1 Tax=Bradyrhizobium genosp. A TaxID=83626 RepID=UPI003CEC43BC
MDQSPIEIFGAPQSNFTRAIRIACEEKAIDYVYHPLAPHSPEVAAIHPLGKIPGLRHGELTLGESRAIMGYLDGMFPESPLIAIGPPGAASEAEQWLSIIMSATDPILIRQYVFAYIFPKDPDGAVDGEAVKAVVPALEAHIALLDKAVSEASFIAADRFTFADALLLSTLAAVRRFPEGASAMERAPSLSRYFQLHAERPSFIKTDPWS